MLSSANARNAEITGIRSSHFGDSAHGTLKVFNALTANCIGG
jgi:hypothetical protein